MAHFSIYNVKTGTVSWLSSPPKVTTEIAGQLGLYKSVAGICNIQWCYGNGNYTSMSHNSPSQPTTTTQKTHLAKPLAYLKPTSFENNALLGSTEYVKEKKATPRHCFVDSGFSQP